MARMFLLLVSLTVSLVACSAVDSTAESAREISATAAAQAQEQLEAIPRPVITFERRTAPTPVPVVHPTMPTPPPAPAHRAARSPTLPTGPTSTPLWTPTPSLAPTTPQPPTATSTLVPTPTNTSTPYPTATPTPRPTRTPTPTPTPAPTLLDLRDLVLELINEEREKNNLQPVALGNNSAAQDHAESMMENNTGGHWGLDGMLPYMRYTLAGGQGYVAENVSGTIINPAAVSRYRSITPQEALERHHRGLMNSPGHRKNILDPWHTHVSLGIACQRYACALVQKFQGDYVSFTETPEFANGILTLKGSMASPFTMYNIAVWYDPPVRPLTPGQLDRTYSYNTGKKPVAFILDPPPPGYYYSDSDLAGSIHSWTASTDPYEVDPNTPRSKIPSASGLPVRPRIPSLGIPKLQVVPKVVADFWRISGESFSIEADLSAQIREHGAGVYTVYIFGENGPTIRHLTNYSIFLK